MSHSRYPDKGKTTWIGSDAERYVSVLLGMTKTPNGNCAPDLISGESYPRRQVLELKSTSYEKGVLVQPQMAYGGRMGLDLFEQGEIRFPFYYGIQTRDKAVTTKDLRFRQDTIKIEWGDLYLFPERIAETYFVIGKALRKHGKDLTQEMFIETLEKTRDRIEEDARLGVSNYRMRIANSNGHNWQNMHTRDIKYLVTEDEELLRGDTEKRVELLQSVVPVSEMRRLKLKGPNGTTIYVMFEKEDEKILKALKRNVRSRIKLVERLTKERREALPLLEKMADLYETVKTMDMLGQSKSRTERTVICGASPKEQSRLWALCNWHD